MTGARAGEAIDAAEFTRRIHELVPISGQLGMIAERLGADGSAEVRLPFLPGSLRPGGSISGPTLMALADVAMFAGVNGRLGWTPMAMTANQNTTFLRPPRPEGLTALATPLRFGRRLAFFSVAIYSQSDMAAPVAHASGSYVLPHKR